MVWIKSILFQDAVLLGILKSSNAFYGLNLPHLLLEMAEETATNKSMHTINWVLVVECHGHFISSTSL